MGTTKIYKRRWKEKVSPNIDPSPKFRFKQIKARSKI